MPSEFADLNDRERLLFEQVAEQRGITMEEAFEQMTKEGLVARLRRNASRATGKVYELPKRKPH